MERWHHGILVGLALGLVAPSCSDRPLDEEEPPPDIEGLCRDYCAKVMECRWSPSAEFDTEEQCRRNCAADVTWDECPQDAEAVYACSTRHDCPEFGDFEFISEACDEEITAYSICL